MARGKRFDAAANATQHTGLRHTVDVPAHGRLRGAQDLDQIGDANHRAFLDEFADDPESFCFEHRSPPIMSRTRYNPVKEAGQSRSMIHYDLKRTARSPR